MKWVSASLKGVKAPRIPNQDIIKVVEFENRFLAVLADGLGSAKWSRLGAKCACESAVQAYLSRSDENCDWIQSIPDIWRQLVNETGKLPSECSTTCALVFVDYSTQTITKASIGDTLVIVKPDDSLSDLDENTDDFLNETTCLGHSDIQRFCVEEFAYSTKFQILLATDGIAEDLELSRIGDFMSFIKKSCARLSRFESRTFLRRNISKAFSKFNNDDKSMIFAWQEN